MQLTLPNGATVFGTADELVDFLNKYQQSSTTTVKVYDPLGPSGSTTVPNQTGGGFFNDHNVILCQAGK